MAGKSSGETADYPPSFPHPFRWLSPPVQTHTGREHICYPCDEQAEVTA